MVEDMVVDNISGNCLILVAIPMTGGSSIVFSTFLLNLWDVDDIENQKAMTLAREQDPDGVRTIGTFLSTFYMA